MRAIPRGLRAARNRGEVHELQPLFEITSTDEPEDIPPLLRLVDGTSGLPVEGGWTASG